MENNFGRHLGTRANCFYDIVWEFSSNLRKRFQLPKIKRIWPPSWSTFVVLDLQLWCLLLCFNVSGIQRKNLQIRKRVIQNCCVRHLGRHFGICLKQVAQPVKEVDLQSSCLRRRFRGEGIQ